MEKRIFPLPVPNFVEFLFSVLRKLWFLFQILINFTEVNQTPVLAPSIIHKQSSLLSFCSHFLMS
jgi:hypothetical protein